MCQNTDADEDIGSDYRRSRILQRLRNLLFFVVVENLSVKIYVYSFVARQLSQSLAGLAKIGPWTPPTLIRKILHHWTHMIFVTFCTLTNF